MKIVLFTGMLKAFSLVHYEVLFANHQFTTNMKRHIYGHATDVVIHPLNEEKAAQATVDLIGELF
ncbi:unnamed protein product, partial [Thlaspi arvense]